MVMLVYQRVKSNKSPPKIFKKNRDHPKIPQKAPISERRPKSASDWCRCSCLPGRLGSETLDR